MPKPTKGPRLGGSPAHQRLILSNLATQLFEHGRITTTESRARALRPVAEKLITKAKRGDLHNRREVLKTVRDKSVVHVLFTEIAPTFAERPGGYTRITKIGPRKGDNAPMAVIELVTEAYKPAAPKAKKAAPATKAPARKVSPSALVVKEGEAAWTKAELKEVLAELREQRDHSLAIVEAQEAELNGLMRDSGDGAGQDQADLGATSFERDHELTVLNSERDKLAQIERALARIDDGTYGVCESCGNPIGKMRLMAFPRATLCMTCKQREERR